MTQLTRRLRWPDLFLAAYVVLIAFMLFAVPAHAATPPRFSILPAAALDNAGSVTVTITKSAKASSYSKLHVFTNNGTALAGTDYGPVDKSITVANATLTIAVPITIMPRAGYQGTRTFTISIIPTRNGTTGSSTATVTINDSEPAPAPAPAPQPCYDYSGPTPLGPVPGSTCPARDCPGSPNPVDWSQPCPSVTPTPAAAPFSIGSLVTRQGLVYRVATNGIPNPFIRPTGPVIYGVQYVSDTTGHYYLADDPGLKQEIQYFYDVNLTPAP